MPIYIGSVRIANGRIPWRRPPKRLTITYTVSTRSFARYCEQNPDPNRTDNRLAFNRKGGVVR